MIGLLFLDPHRSGGDVFAQVLTAGHVHEWVGERENDAWHYNKEQHGDESMCGDG